MSAKTLRFKIPLETGTGFTLIELSIVLIVIGLITSGVLVGQDLIAAAEMRAQIGQIEKLNTAVNTFHAKYGGLPGDLPNPTATQFGFVARGQWAGEGDGNGVIEGINGDVDGANNGIYASTGESAAFWSDLSSAQLFGGSFTATETFLPAAVITSATSPNIDFYIPRAAIGKGNYLYIWSGGVDPTLARNNNHDGINYIGLSVADTLDRSVFSHPGLTVVQAYNIDSKMDDGLPFSGRVLASYTSAWAFYAPYDTTDKATTCMNTTNLNYSMGPNGGTGINCALSFRLQ